MLQLYSLVGQSQRACLVFLQSRDRQLHHANVPCLDDAGEVLGELHDHSVGDLYPIGACDVQVIVVGPAEYRADLHAQAKFL